MLASRAHASPMFRVWLHVEELDEDGEPDGEPLDPIDIADFDDLGEAEIFIDRLLTVCEGVSGLSATPPLPTPESNASIPGIVGD